MKYFTILIFLLISSPATAQHIATTFQKAEKTGYSMYRLDKRYPSAIHSDSTKAVFKGAAQAKFIEAYKTMLYDLNSYLNKNNFTWGKPTRIFNRIYFKPNGSIDYYLVNLALPGTDTAKAKQFIPLLSQFIQNYKIKITAKTKFAQCSPVIYKDVKGGI